MLSTSMKKPLTQQVFVFSVLWVAFGSVYFLRKPVGIIKVHLQESFKFEEKSLGYVDVAFSLPCALVSIFLGKIADILGPRITLGCGLIGSAAASSMMGLTTNYMTFLILLSVSGAFQSLAWPSTCSLLSSWFSKDVTTSIMGIFGTNFLVGSTGGALLTVFILSYTSWRYVFYIPSAFVATMGIIVLLFIKPKEEQNDITTNEEGIVETYTEDKKVGDKKNVSLNFWQVLCIPIVPFVSVSLFCMNGIRDTILFWLPFYLTSVLDFNDEEAALISLTFEMGGFLGVSILTVMIDKFMRDKELLAMSISSLICGCFIPLLLLTETYGLILLYISIFFCGAFWGTVEALGDGALPSKIGEKYGARASITGVINGLGSIGSVVEGPIVAFLFYSYGKKSLVAFIVVLSLISTCASLIAFWTDRRNKVPKKCRNANENT